MKLVNEQESKNIDLLPFKEMKVIFLACNSSLIQITLNLRLFGKFQEALVVNFGGKT